MYLWCDILLCSVCLVIFPYGNWGPRYLPIMFFSSTNTRKVLLPTLSLSMYGSIYNLKNFGSSINLRPAYGIGINQHHFAFVESRSFMCLIKNSCSLIGCPFDPCLLFNIRRYRYVLRLQTFNALAPKPGCSLTRLQCCSPPSTPITCALIHI